MRKIGYARVSSLDQNLARQLKQLENEGCNIIYQEKISGATTERPELRRMMDSLEAGDIICILDLTRFSRSTKDLLALIEEIKEKGASLKSIKDKWLDTTDTNPFNDFLLTVMAGMSQYERSMIRIRQAEGIKLAKERNAYKGSTKKYTEAHTGLKHALDLYTSGQGYTVKDVCKITGISEATFYRNLKRRREEGKA